MLKALCIAFSTYSRIPMPRVDWSERAMGWSVCFFPLVGAVVGGAELLWQLISAWLNVNFLLRGAVAAALPILITGGIHLDGFCDTMDALSSHQSRERKLEILKDPRAGAFAVIYGGVWLLLDAAGWCSVDGWRAVSAAGLGFVLSRALSGLALTNWRCARTNGMLRSFADAAHRRAVTVTMLVYIILCMALLLLCDLWLGAGVILVNAAAFLGYRRMAYRQFGGVTGDLAGWFTQLAELGTILVLALMGGVA